MSRLASESFNQGAKKDENIHIWPFLQFSGHFSSRAMTAYGSLLTRPCSWVFYEDKGRIFALLSKAEPSPISLPLLMEVSAEVSTVPTISPGALAKTILAWARAKTISSGGRDLVHTSMQIETSRRTRRRPCGIPFPRYVVFLSHANSRANHFVEYNNLVNRLRDI
jgi:hypothetical protein